MGLFDTPDPPDPRATAAAQTGTNVATAVANANLGNVNQVTPSGDLTYSEGTPFSWADPVTGQTYSIPKFTATQSLTPVGQSTFESQQRAGQNLAWLGEDASVRMRQQLGGGIDLSGGAPYGDVGTLSSAEKAQTGFATGSGPATTFGDAGPIGTTFANAPDIQQSYQHGDDFSADRQRIEAGLMERLNPSLQQERNKYEQQLADQGIRYGSKAYEDAMRNYSMQATDARLGVIGQGGIEQQRLSDISRQAGEFFNKGQQQAYEQAKGRGEFANQAEQQQYEQLFGRGQFYNAGQQQNFAQDAMRGTFANAARAQNFQQAQSAFNASNAARQQFLNETFALRNQPINEISALLSGSQVSQPNFLQTSSATIPTTDVAGLMNRNFDQQMAISNQQAATANNIIGGVFGMAGGLARGGALGGR